MKPARCFRDLASFSNRQKRLQQNRRYAVDIHNGKILERLLVILLATRTNVVLFSCSIGMKKTPLGFPSPVLIKARYSLEQQIIVPIAVFSVTTGDLQTN